MPKTKYEIGCLIQNKYKLLSRDYKESNGNWVCSFECQECKQVFQNRLNKVVDNKGIKCLCSQKPKINLLGQTKGAYTIIDIASKRENDRNFYWKCQCKCGKIFEISTTDFNRRNHTICPHSSSTVGGRTPKYKEKDKIGELTLLEYLGEGYWNCQCSCGTTLKRRTDQFERDFQKCSNCSSNSKGEEKITQLLREMNIEFIFQKTFENCRFPNTNALARFDFYLPNFNCVLEYNGSQHYKFRDSGWNTEENYKQTIYRDNYKKAWCKNNQIKFIEIPYTDFDKINKNYLLSLLS